MGKSFLPRLHSETPKVTFCIRTPDAPSAGIIAYLTPAKGRQGKTKRIFDEKIRGAAHKSLQKCYNVCVRVKNTKLPVPTIQRYPVYLRVLRKAMNAGMKYVSGAMMAEQLGIDGVLTRKDLAKTGVVGRPRLGYPAKTLYEAMRRALGWHQNTKAALIGVGSLGSALAGYDGFAEQNLSIAVAFDADAAIAGRTVNGIKVRPMRELAELIASMEIKIALLSVPDFAAQECADALVAAGIRGILNFTSVVLNAPAKIRIENVDIAQALAVLSHSIDNLPEA